MLPPELVITEGTSGTYFYHLSYVDTMSVSLCGLRTMHTFLPSGAWGVTTHLAERYCNVCARRGRLSQFLTKVGIDAC